MSLMFSERNKRLIWANCHAHIDKRMGLHTEALINGVAEILWLFFKQCMV